MTPSYHKLTLHNSFTRKKEAFDPIEPGHVRVYYCGPTVYDAVHIGNLRAMLSADTLIRLLRRLYPQVTYVRNITDVDDKITARAAENGESIAALTARTAEMFHADVAELAILPPNIEPRATHHIGDMLEMITTLLASGHAYMAEGHVLFSIENFESYGALSGRSPEELLAGARVEVAPYKRHPGDFVLWKPSRADQPGWESPFGFGRPGWHIECSAMSRRYLGESFDIHGGGDDLLFPHHENERAQSLCCAPSSRFANIWLHNAMLLSNGEKMSKSLDNFYTVRDVLSKAPAEALRLLMLGTHYRSILDFSWDRLADAKYTLDRFYRALETLKGVDLPAASVSPEVMEALCDDLNTPQALAHMHHEAACALKGDHHAAASLKASGSLLGILRSDSDQWFGRQNADPDITHLVATRSAAKAARDFVRADAIRDQLQEMGIILEDTAQGTIWRRL